MLFDRALTDDQRLCIVGIIMYSTSVIKITFISILIITLTNMRVDAFFFLSTHHSYYHINICICLHHEAFDRPHLDCTYICG